MTKLTFSSDQLPAQLDSRTRFKLWRDMWVANYGLAEMSHAEDRPFAARTEMVQIDRGAVILLETSTDRWERTREHISRDGQDDLLIGFSQNRARHAVSHAGRDFSITPGSVLTMSKGLPCDSRTGGHCRWLAVAAPMEEISQAVSGAREKIGVLLDGKSAPVRHLERYAAFLLSSSELTEDVRLGAKAKTMLFDLVALCLGATGDAAELARGRGLRAARIHDVLELISRHFADPHFSLQMVAAKLGIAPRYVQDLIHATGSSFTERVVEKRLQKARLMLTDPRNDRVRISEIALACGFNEVSYFNRRFRRRFGAKPKEVRGGREI